jgi:hypothetical protein
MSIATREVARKFLIGAAVLVVGVGAAAPAGAEPDAVDVNGNLFGGLTCTCEQTAPVTGPGVGDEISRGLHNSHSVWAGMSAPMAQR